MIDLIYTAGDNAQLLTLCTQANWLPGLRSDKYPCALATSIQFLDVRIATPNFPRHLELVKRFRPRYAVVPDLSEREVSQDDITRALRQTDLLAPYCDVVLLVPKLSGQIALLPKHLAIGYSVPTRYSSAQYPLHELEGRQVHLLGGSPHKQLLFYRYITCFAQIISLDGNMYQKMSRYGKFWHAGRWLDHPQRGSARKQCSYECVAWSLHNIRQAWLSLFSISRYPSCGDGLGMNWQCVFCQDAKRFISRPESQGTPGLVFSS